MYAYVFNLSQQQRRNERDNFMTFIYKCEEREKKLYNTL